MVHWLAELELVILGLVWLIVQHYYLRLIALPQEFFLLLFSFKFLSPLQTFLDILNKLLIGLYASLNSQIFFVQERNFLELVDKHVEHLEGVEGGQVDSEHGDFALKVFFGQVDTLILYPEF